MLTEDTYNKGREWRFRIQALSETVWEGHAKEQGIQDWLNGFVGAVCDIESERHYALFLLHQFIYFGQTEVDALLYSMFRDHILYPEVQKYLASNPSLNDLEIRQLLENAMANIKIVPVGDISESGPMLSYRLRQVASLPPESIKSMNEVLIQVSNNSSSIKHIILTDDFLGTGDQLCEKHTDQVRKLKLAGVTVDYVALVGMQRGLENVRSGQLFDNVNVVVSLDHTYSLSQKSCIHLKEIDSHAPLSSIECCKVINYYGNKLASGSPLGYKNCGVMVGFNHNTPDNSLPIFWMKSVAHQWTPLFERHEKVKEFNA